ncbi:hypothetical protein [Nonomuraea turcica]|uniref:hypothetical protein n=1 Tax=Nonomuraea sp. G32 TaxID=3067274 RepID=UPI00273B6BFA|nr:hypothetical protein [Nonomuraea sp. G32]MDP4505710.1 hypothetical protein [Nonomuraea sp. G32]
MRKSAKVLAAATLFAAGTVLAHPAPAMAAAPYTPERACAKESGRGGWTHVKDNKRALKNGRSTWGYVYLMWNRGLQKNCVTVIKTTYAGTPTYTQAILHVEGGGAYRDPGTLTKRKYGHYAAAIGYGKGYCVDFEGHTTDTRKDFGIASARRGKFMNCG